MIPFNIVLYYSVLAAIYFTVRAVKIYKIRKRISKIQACLNSLRCPLPSKEDVDDFLRKCEFHKAKTDLIINKSI